MKITARATYETITPGEGEDYEIEGGFTDPRNPWGGFRIELPADVYGERAKEWMKDNVEVVEFATIREAAEFVLEFPGAVWDYGDLECDASVDYQTGAETTVMLHVIPHTTELFKMVDELRKEAI